MFLMRKDYLRVELYLFWDIWNVEAIGNYPVPSTRDIDTL